MSNSRQIDELVEAGEVIRCKTKGSRTKEIKDGTLEEYLDRKDKDPADLSMGYLTGKP